MRKVSFPLLVRLQNSCESRHLFHRDIDAIDFARVYSRWSRPTASVAFHISIVSHRGLTSASEHSCPQAALSSRRKVFPYDIAMTTVGGDEGRRIGEKHLKSVCSSGTHRKLCVPLLALFHMLLPYPLSCTFHFFLLFLSSIGAYEIRRNPRKIALSLTRKTKVSERKKKNRKSSRRSLSTQTDCHLCSLIRVSTFFEIFIILYIFI